MSSIFIPKRSKNIYFIGIGGIGMSALARWFLAQPPNKGESRQNGGKWAVFGSDSAESEVTQELIKEGVRVKIGHKKANLDPKIDIVVKSQAIKDNNPEIQRVRELGLPVITYPEAVGLLTKKYKTVALAGAHGKSTTTAMVSLILIEAGFDPTVIIGTKLKEFKGPPSLRRGSPSKQIKVGGRNFRFGRGKWLVLEADEYGGAFLHYSPFIGGVTNIDREHLDYYKNFSNIKKAFGKFKKNCENFITPVKSKNIESKIKKILKVPGEHNIKNALLAYSVARYLKIPEKTILHALGKFHGTWRRMEYRGELRIINQELRSKSKKTFQASSFKFQVYDDYAHHPTEIKATLQAFREKFSRPVPGRGSFRRNGVAASKIVCVFQPHQAERLKLLFKEFVGAFKEADALILLPSYKVTGRENATSDKRQATRGKTAEDLYIATKKKYPKKPVFYLKNPKEIKSFLKKALLTTHYPLPTIIVMMGAGDIYKYTRLLLKK